MIARCTAIAATLVAVVWANVQATPAKNEGGMVWRLLKIEMLGKQVKTGEIRLHLDAPNFKFVAGKKVTMSGTYSVRTVAGQADEFDMHSTNGAFKGKTLKGIYRSMNNKLWICFSVGDRPSKFATSAKDGALTWLSVYELEK